MTTEQKIAILEISERLARDCKAEADANEKYFSDLAEILANAQAAALPLDTIQKIEDTFTEIIADENNHLERFYTLQVLISGIEAKGD